MLATHSSQAASAATVEAIGDLEKCHEREDFGCEFHDGGVIVEDFCKMVFRNHENGENDGADNHAEECSRVRSSCSALCVFGAEEIAHSCTSCDTDAERDGVHNFIRSHNHTLGGERDGSQSTGSQSHDFERPPFCADMNDAKGGEAGEGADVVDTAARPAAPCRPPLDVAGVGEEEQK